MHSASVGKREMRQQLFRVGSVWVEQLSNDAPSQMTYMAKGLVNMDLHLFQVRWVSGVGIGLVVVQKLRPCSVPWDSTGGKNPDSVRLDYLLHVQSNHRGCHWDGNVWPVGQLRGGHCFQTLGRPTDLIQSALRLHLWTTWCLNLVYSCATTVQPCK